MSIVELGIKIYLDARVAENKGIGLYLPVSGNSIIRWSTGEIEYETDEWASNVITAKSISKINQSIDLRISGNILRIGGIQAAVDNTNKLYQTLEQTGVYINGLLGELYEFNMQTETTSLLYRGICQVSEWDETEYRIEIVSPLDKRRSNIGKQLKIQNDDGDYEITDIPVVYGYIDKCPFVRGTVDENILTLSDYFLNTEIYPSRNSYFPVIETTNPTSRSLEDYSIYVRIGDTTTITDTVFKEKFDPTGKYLKVVSGASNGTYREIRSCSYRPDRSIKTGNIIYNRLVLLCTPEFVYYSYKLDKDTKNWLPSNILTYDSTFQQCYVVSATEAYVLSSKYVYKSVDKGVSFTKIGTLPGYHISLTDYHICDDGTQFYTWLNSLYRSTDGGVSFSLLKTFEWNGAYYHASMTDSNNIVAVGDDGAPVVYRTTDGGLSWTPVTGTPMHLASKIPYAITNYNSVFYAGGQTGHAMYSSDGGATWTSFGVTTGNTIQIMFVNDIGIYSYIGPPFSLKRWNGTLWENIFILLPELCHGIYMATRSGSDYKGVLACSNALYNAGCKVIDGDNFSSIGLAGSSFLDTHGVWGSEYEETINYSDYPILKIDLDTWPEQFLYGSWDYSDGPEDEDGLVDRTLSIIQIVSLDRTFETDNQDSLGILNYDFTQLQDSDIYVNKFGSKLYVDYNSVTGLLNSTNVLDYGVGFLRLPGIAFSVTSKQYEVSYDATYSQSDPNKIVGVTYYPFSKIEFLTDLDMSNWVRSSEIPDDFIRDWWHDELEDNEGSENLAYDILTYTPKPLIGGGVYSNGPINTTTAIIPTIDDLANLKDRDHTTYARWYIDPVPPVRIATTDRKYITFINLIVTPPDIPVDEFDELYIALKVTSTQNMVRQKPTYITIKAFTYGLKPEDVFNNYDVGSDEIGLAWAASKPIAVYNESHIDFNNFLNEYWNTTYTGNGSNRDHYATYTSTDFYDRLIRSYKLFNCTDIYSKATKFLISFNFSGSVDLKIYEISFLAKKTNTLGKKIFLPYGGRIDPFGDFVNNPVDVIRDILYRQNWSELNVYPPSGGWGNGHSTDVLIKEGPSDYSIGSFDYEGLDDIKASVKCNFTVTSYSFCWSDILTKKLCQQFFLAQYQDNNGYECIDAFTLAFPDDLVSTLTLHQINEISPIIYPDQQSIYINSTVLYNKDNATGAFRNYISLTNAEQPDYDPSYVVEYGKDELDMLIENLSGGTPVVGNFIKGGTSNAVGFIKMYLPEEGVDESQLELEDLSGIFLTNEIITEYSDSACTIPTGVTATVGTKIDPYGIWDLAHLLWIKYHQNNEAPKTMTELDLITDRETAAWYLKTWLTWQNKKRIKFKVPYDVASSWHVCTRFGIKLPHQTDNDTIYCIVEKIDKDLPLTKGSTYIEILAVMYNFDDFEDSIIQDIYERPDPDWQDVETTSSSGKTTQDSPV